MTPLAVLAALRRSRLAVRVDGAGQLRLRGRRSALSRELREHLDAVRPELVELLTSADARRRSAADAWAGAFRRLCALARDWPAGGLATLNRLRPGLLREIATAEVEGETATVAYRDGSASVETLLIAIQRWEQLMLEGLRFLERACCECGQEASVFLVDPVDGSRFCRRCLWSEKP